MKYLEEAVGAGKSGPSVGKKLDNGPMKSKDEAMQSWVFDFDGTLVNSEGYFSRSFGYALEPFDVTIDREYIENVRHRHPDKIFQHLLDPHDEKLALKRLKEADVEISKEIKFFPGMLELLEKLKKAGHRVSIWTGRDRASTLRILDHQNAKDHFHEIVSGTCVEHNKPGLDGLLKIKELFPVEPGSMYMVGDHHHDIEPANQVGCVSVHARWKNNYHELPGGIQAQHSFDNIERFFVWALDHS